MGVAHWVNNSVALFLGPFVLLRRWRGLWRAEAMRTLVLLAAGYVIGQALMGLADYHPTDLSALPASEWPRAWRELLRVSSRALGPPVWPVAMALELVVGFAGLIGIGRGRIGRSGWSALALLATSTALWLLMGTRMWVKINDYEFRYLFPSILLVQTAASGLILAARDSPKAPRRRVDWRFAVGSTFVLVAASTWSYGLPSLAGVRRDVDRKCGALTEDILDSGSTCLAGDYWTVWPSVFHANLVLRERGDSRVIRGVTFRASPTFQLWKRSPMASRLAAVPIGDGQGEIWLRSYQFPKLREVEVRRTIRVLRPIPPVRANP
jgi:hypothetical protein